jgi:ATP diphosphatase
VLDGVPSAAPALLRAERLTEKASRIGFDWPDLKGVRAKLDEELDELDEAIARGDRDELELELGDVLFSLANLARFIKTPAEDALRRANRRFTERFHEIEAGLEAEQVPFGEATLDQMERHWQRAKEKEKAVPPPRALPRAAPSELRLPVERLEEVVAFWDKLAPAIGWHRARGSADERHYTDGQLRLAFVRATGPAAYPPGSARLCFEAPSRRAVDALHAELASWSTKDPGGPPAPPRPQARGSEYALDFSDPSGLVLSYAFQGP